MECAGRAQRRRRYGFARLLISPGRVGFPVPAAKAVSALRSATALHVQWALNRLFKMCFRRLQKHFPPVVSFFQAGQ
jgi:hypothetical protein